MILSLPTARRVTPALGVLLLHMVLWKLTPIYRVFPLMDRVVHVLGGAAAAWFLLHWLRPIWVLLAMAGVVICWEFLEWGLDAVGWTESHRTSHENAMDMLMGIVGAVLLLLMVRKK